MRRSILASTALCAALFAPLTASAQVASQTASPAPAAEPTTRDALEDGINDRRWYPATGRDLVALIKDCDSADCMSYTAGMISGLATRAYLFGEDHPFCAGDNAHITDIRDAIVTVVEADEQMAQAPSSFAVLAAFAATWPCAEDDATVQDSATTAPETDAGLVPVPIEALTALEAGSVLTLIDNTPVVLEKGDPAASILNTLTVFHDVNCPHCASFRTETDALAEQGWRVRVVPVGIMSPDSQGYAALMAAFAGTRPDLVEALYREAVPGQATVASGLAVLERLGINAADALSAVSANEAYAAVTTNNDRMFAIGGQGTPTWVLGDYMVTGGLEADRIAELATRLPVPPGATGLERPTQGADTSTTTPLILNGIEDGETSETPTQAPPTTETAPAPLDEGVASTPTTDRP